MLKSRRKVEWKREGMETRKGEMACRENNNKKNNKLRGGWNEVENEGNENKKIEKKNSKER